MEHSRDSAGGFRATGRKLPQERARAVLCRGSRYGWQTPLFTTLLLLLVQVIHVDMYDAPARMPPLMVNYHRDLAKATTGQDWRDDLQPINITQPEGPSFSVEGSLVRRAAAAAAVHTGVVQGCSSEWCLLLVFALKPS